MRASPHLFCEEANLLWNIRVNTPHNTFRAFLYRAYFGLSSYTTAVAWNRLDDLGIIPQELLPKHLLWTLMWLKVYNTEPVMCNMIGTSDKTFCKYRDICLNCLSKLGYVSKYYMKTVVTSVNE